MTQRYKSRSVLNGVWKFYMYCQNVVITGTGKSLQDAIKDAHTTFYKLEFA